VITASARAILRRLFRGRRVGRVGAIALPTVAASLLAYAVASAVGEGTTIRGSATYRPEVVGGLGVVAAGRHFAAEAGMRMLARGGNAIDAGVAATFAAAVSEISHFGLGGEVPIVLYLADRKDVVVLSGARDRAAEFGASSLGDALGSAIVLADGFPWYEFLTRFSSRTSLARSSRRR
jgi:gamma-glutamyltranspeptidase/glutathione hydrolase